MADSWPAKSVDEKLEAILPLARQIAGAIARRCPIQLRDDIFAAAAIGAWETVRRYHEADRVDVLRVAAVRIRGAVIDELRHQDFRPRRQVTRDEYSIVRLDTANPEHRLALSAPATQEDGVDANAETERLYGALARLSERERGILVDFYLRGERMKVIGARLGISEARISQIRKRAVERLRAAMT